jgi:predicted P-loop ATPase
MAFYPSLFSGEPAPEDEKPIFFDDNYVPSYLYSLQKRLRDLGFVGKRYPSTEVSIYALKLRAWKKQRNLFREWLESLKWDGKPRLRRWFIDGLGVTAPPLEETGQDQEYLESATEAWFLGAVNRQYEPTKVEIVPVFIGGEGIGKGNFLRYTAGYRDEWFIDTSATLRGAGAEQKFLEGIKGRIIVELSESVQFSTKEDVELLKTFVSKTEDQSRKPYAMFSPT